MPAPAKYIATQQCKPIPISGTTRQEKQNKTGRWSAAQATDISRQENQTIRQNTGTLARSRRIIAMRLSGRQLLTGTTM